ncbi:MAG: hypothetical protein JXL97_09860 [Bacteroidales bacterium]|nr:hypothetical protein [Bacteroidales bacterium]
MKNYCLLLLIISFSFNIFSQNIDSTKMFKGFEMAYHNVPVFQAPKGKFYYKNSELFYQSFGKNFWNVLEIETGAWLPPIKALSGYFQSRIILPIHKKINFGVTGSVFGSAYDFPSLKIRDKYEIAAGLSYKSNKSLHAINICYDNIIAVNYITMFKIYGFGFDYTLIKQFTNNVFFISDNKISYATIDFLEPDNFGNRKILLLEQNTAVRHFEKKHAFNIGILTYIGYYQKDKQFKYKLLPYFSYQLIL